MKRTVQYMCIDLALFPLEYVGQKLEIYAKLLPQIFESIIYNYIFLYFTILIIHVYTYIKKNIMINKKRRNVPYPVQYKHNKNIQLKFCDLF